MGGNRPRPHAFRALVRDDTRGDKLGPVIRDRRVDKGMPAFRLSDSDLAAVIAFIHDQKTKAASLVGAPVVLST